MLVVESEQVKERQSFVWKYTNTYIGHMHPVFHTRAEMTLIKRN